MSFERTCTGNMFGGVRNKPGGDAQKSSPIKWGPPRGKSNPLAIPVPTWNSPTKEIAAGYPGKGPGSKWRPPFILDFATRVEFGHL